MSEAVWVPGSHTQILREACPCTELGGVQWKNQKASTNMSGEPEASVPWEELRVTAFLFKDSTELPRGYCGFGVGSSLC